MSETRKLAAILVSDVVGYSRLAGADEDRILTRLRALRSDLIDPTIAVHHGRVVKRTGDGSIIEFRSVVDAVNCAIEVQRAMVERNAGVAPDKRIEFRIGIHLGDVVEESDGDLMGVGVNIAARLEGVCEPSGVCLSEDAYRQVRDKVKEKFVDLGEKELKNIARPVRVYGVPLRPTDASNEPSTILDRPSIAVLAFNNMSGDPSQEFIADGITEDVTALLSRLPGFFVIARNTAFTYKGRAVDTREVARELGVRYRPAHAILSAALSFGSFAAFSDDLKEMGRESLAEARKAVELDGDNPDVLLAAGVSNFFLGLLKRSHGLLERAVELNPNNAMACAAFGKSLAVFGRPDEGVKLIERAMRLSPRDPQTYLFQAWLGFCHFFAGRFDEAIQWSEHSSWAKPRYVESWLNMAAALAEAERPEEAGRAIRKARELVPRLSLAIFRRAYADGTLWPKFIDGVRKAGMPEE